ncbi:MAG: sulfatase [Ignavibacteriales bacterium]|nr:sulfatase [Ignavibacteriales bacterium]
MNQSRREFLTTTAAIGVGGVLAALPFGKAFGENSNLFSSFAGRKKNVLFIAVDDLRPELGCYGHPMVKSPNIDALAKSGVLFERTYCQQAVCAPTRASLLTGRRPDTTKIYDLKTHIRTTMPNVVTLQQYFKNNGYFSEGMGKLFHAGYEDEKSYSMPHRYAKADPYALEENIHLKKDGGKVTTKNKEEADAESRMRGPATECADVQDNVYEDGKYSEMAIESLRRLAPKAKSKKEGEHQPFFLGVGFRKPHLPFVAPKKYWDLYDRSKIPMPYPERPHHAPDLAFANWGELRSYSDIPDVGPCDEAKTRELIHGYYACVSYMDAQVGKVLAELDRLDLRKDTSVVIWGDHGWKLGEYSEWSKHTNFELDTHAPLIISDPDLPKGVRTSGLTEFVDIYPTLTALCGLPQSDGMEGTSMVPLLSDPKKQWKKAAFSQYPRGKKIMGYSMRTDQYRYNEWIELKTNDIVARELYDLKNDPLCKECIVDEPQYKDLIASLHDMLAGGKGWKKYQM